VKNREIKISLSRGDFRFINSTVGLLKKKMNSVRDERCMNEKKADYIKVICKG